MNMNSQFSAQLTNKTIADNRQLVIFNKYAMRMQHAYHKVSWHPPCAIMNCIKQLQHFTCVCQTFYFTSIAKRNCRPT